mgnify:CR=1 FL=1
MGIRIQVHHADRLPRSPFLMISNHRSFLDAPLLVAAAAQPVHFELQDSPQLNFIQIPCALFAISGNKREAAILI